MLKAHEDGLPIVDHIEVEIGDMPMKGSKKLLDCVAVLEDGSKIRIPITGFKEEFDYGGTMGANYDPRSHQSWISLYGFRVHVIDYTGKLR